MKTNLKTTLSVIIFLSVISCTKESIKKISTTSTEQIKQNGSFYVGQHYGGGIIFYIDSTGKHGLIADTVDLSKKIAWWNGVNVATGATSTSIGGGKSNTKKIIKAQGKPGRYAALKCAHYSGSEYTDWFLPSKGELNKLFQEKDLIGGFENTGYWSSTEGAINGYVWYQDFTFGTQDNLSKNNNTINIRPIRYF